MNRYYIQITEKTIKDVCVEAESEDEAFEIACAGDAELIGEPHYNEDYSFYRTSFNFDKWGKTND